MSVGRNGVLTIFLFISFVFSANLKNQNRLINGVESYRLTVKFQAESGLLVKQGRANFSHKVYQNGELQNLLSQYHLKQLLTYSESERELIKTGRHLQRRGGFNRLAFCGLVEVLEAPSLSPQEVLALAQKLESYDEVEYCAIEDVQPTPPPSSQKIRVTPDFSYRQWYKELNHGGDTIGINIEAAWVKGIKGAGISIADIEWGMDYLHEDLQSPKFIEGLKTTDNSYDDHGTAVAGILIAKDNGFGVTGMVPDYEAFYGFSERTKGRVAAIAMAIDSLEAGDVLIYEMQTGGQNGEFVPADYNQGVWDITQAATDAGIIICAAAGNGNQNLDGSFYSAYMDRGDNGAIIVGAGTIKGRNKASFSTYGSRVNVQGWGDFCVTTTGYTSLHNGGPHAKYTKNFSGTSSATPIVSSAVVAIQSYAKEVLGKTLTPREMRALLKKTGTPQGGGGHIGPLPNVGAAITELGGTVIEKFSLTITGGEGAGEYKEGEKITVVASSSNPKETFLRWEGDTAYIEDATQKSSVVTMPAKDISLSALWAIDTLTSENVILYAGWEAIADSIGSEATIDLDSSAQAVDSLFISLSKVKQSVDTIYPYANGTGYFENGFDEVHTIEIRYSASADMKMLLPMENSTDSDGSAHFVLLPKAENRLVQFSPAEFLQPEWQKEKSDLNLKSVRSVSFEIAGDENSDYLGDIAVYSLKMDDYTPTSVAQESSLGGSVTTALVGESVLLTTLEESNVHFELYGINGKRLMTTTKSYPAGAHSLNFSDLHMATGVYILQVSSENCTHKMRFVKE